MGMLLKRREKVNLTTSAGLNGMAEETPVKETEVKSTEDKPTKKSRSKKEI